MTFRNLSNEELEEARVGLKLEKESEIIAKQKEFLSRIKTKAYPLWKYFARVQAFLNRFINFSLLAQWMIGFGSFISVAPYGFIIGVPMYFIGAIIYWTTKEHIIDKISWIFLPIIFYVVFVFIVYGS